MMKIGNQTFDTKHQTYVMGILNVTPDSFSDGGLWKDEKKALHHVEKMVNEGAHIIDVGGESTRPGYLMISDEEEIKRVAPVIRRIKEEFNVPVSIDTYKSEVAKAAIDAGADMVNDIWGLKQDKKMADVIAGSGVACCLMHNKKEAVYDQFMDNMLMELNKSIQLAKQAGIAEDKIMVDPGVGFAKSYEQNLEAIRYLEKLQELGYPVLLGTSRKSVIGLTLDLPTEERLEGTLVTTVMGVMKGASFVRVHDVKENVRAILMAQAILGRG